MPDHFLAHRGLWRESSEQNSLAALEAALRAGHGIETDLRSRDGTLVLAHDPPRVLDAPPRFDGLLTRLERFPHSRCFLNVKEDGLVPYLERYRDRLLALPVVFFDMSVPELVRYAKRYPPSHLAARVSDVEPEPHGASFCRWLWVDGFFRDPTEEELARLVARHPHALAIVAPELHGRAGERLAALIARGDRLAERERLWCADLAAQTPQVGEGLEVRTQPSR